MEETNFREELIARHKKEKKELLAETQKMKHSVPKGDKKKKKDIISEIDQMISDLNIKHEKELQDFEESRENASEDTNSSSASSNLKNEKSFYQKVDNKASAADLPRISKAQKRRNKKAQLDKEREKAIAEQDIQNLQGSRFLESAELEKKLLLRNLSLHEIASDGNCLYKAIEHQLSFHNMQMMTADSLRQLTSSYLLENKEEFIPFLTNPETGDILTDVEYVAYCEDIKKPSTWGGQVEIQALSQICKLPIEVIQADAPSIITGEGTVDKRLIISYHRHAFGLGEHYNSVIPKCTTSP